MSNDDPFTASTPASNVIVGDEDVNDASPVPYALNSPPHPSRLQSFGGTTATEVSHTQPPRPPKAENQFGTTPIKDNYNKFLYTPVTGTQRNPFLIGKGGMGPRFCQFTVSDFSSRVHGPLPTPDDRKKFKGADLSKVKVEKDIYPILTEVIDSVLSALPAKTVRVLETPSHRAADGNSSRRDSVIDAGIYLSSQAALDATTLSEKQRKNSQIKPEELAKRPHLGSRSWHWLAIPIEVKLNIDNTPFYFSNKSSASQKPCAQSSSSANATGTSEPGQKPFIRGSAKGEEALGQFVEYMLNVFDNQHRTFSYAIYVWHRLARLCFFDQGGAVISEAFDWTTPDSPLHDFMWKVANMEVEDLGYDPTATLATDEEAKNFTDMAENSAVHEKIREFVKQATAPGQPIYKVEIIPMAAPHDEGFPDDPSPPPSSPTFDPSSPAGAPPEPALPVAPKPRSFLIGKTHFSSHSLIGRCTRGYIAYDIEEQRLCFLKDYWRPYVPHRTRPEHLVLERMARHNVTGIATLICGGDVGGVRAQMSRVQSVLYHLGSSPPAPRSHYRMATVEIGLPLESFDNFKQLSLIFADAVLAHYLAWTNAKVLHRDISIGNILINPCGSRGLLIDWDLCRLEHELASGPTEPDRTGTWQWRSALCVTYPRKPYRLSDDLESFVHAYNYLVLKYHPISDNALHFLVTGTYESYSMVRGIKVGGPLKAKNFKDADPPFEVCNNETLQMIVEALHLGCHRSYKELDFKQMKALYGISNSTVEKTDGSGSGEEIKDEEIFLRPCLDDLATSTSIHRDLAPSSSFPTMMTGPSSRTTPAPAAADPCELQGFLSHHRDLHRVFLSHQGKKARMDKHDNQFIARASENPTPLLLELKAATSAPCR